MAVAEGDTAGGGTTGLAFTSSDLGKTWTQTFYSDQLFSLMANDLPDHWLDGWRSPCSRHDGTILLHRGRGADLGAEADHGQLHAFGFELQPEWAGRCFVRVF